MDSPDAEAMFGDMFDEPEGPVQGCAPNPSPKVNGKKVEAPPPGRGETGFCGIKNQGATCYLNSLIQTLLLTPELREELFRLGPDELGKIEDVKKKNAKVRKIPIQLQMLLARLLLLNQNACGTESLTESFGWVDSEELQQHDVQELSRILFCAIEDSLVGTSGRDIIKNLYRGVSANTIACLSCNKVSENTEEFLDLNIAIAAQNSLTAVFRDMFVEIELMKGKNQYHCDQCEKLVDAQKGAVIKTLPPILTISLLRFSFDYNTFRRFKETRKFEFPLYLNMKPYCETYSTSGCFEYDLYSVIIHSGSAYGGHYHAYIRDVDGLGTVPADYNPTPPKVIPPLAQKNDVLPNDYIDDPLEMLAYVLGKLGGENVPINRLGDAFREESGTSWVKQYKRKYGTMTKFIQSCYDTFVVDNRAKTVSFRTKKSGHGNNLHKHAPRSFNGRGDANHHKLQNYDAVNGESYRRNGEGDYVDSCDNNISGDDEERLFDCDIHPLCNVWFDFNDSHVKPITTHDIEKQFEGRESAYMLFYRRRDLKRPLASLGNAINGIPDHIRAKIQEENYDLDKLRTDYDSYLNIVTLRVFFSSMFTYKNGLVKLSEADDVDPSEYGFSYSIDRRKLVTEMIAELKQMGEKHEEETCVNGDSELQCNVMKILDHGGVHLYDRLDNNTDGIIGQTTLDNGQKLVLWNGCELQGVNVTPGVANEPIVLDVRCKICGGSNLLSFDFKGVTYGNVAISNLQKFFLEKFKMRTVTQSKIGSLGEDGNLIEFTETEMEKNLSEVKKFCDQSVAIELIMGDADTSINNDDADILTLQIAPGDRLEEELHERGYYGSPHKIFVTTAIKGVINVLSFMDVKHLKFSILHWLLPEFKGNYDLNDLHLYIEKEAFCDAAEFLKLSLHEKQSLSQAGLSDDVSSVKLEVGPPPDRREYHVTVYVQKGSKLKLPVKKCQAVPVVCLKSETIANLIEKIVSEQHLNKDARHLRILKSDKEVGEVITNPEQVLERTAIKHGSTLVLCPGGVPSDGQVRIPICYYSILPSFDYVLTRIRDNPTLEAWQSFLSEDESQPLTVGYVEIEKDATLFDLKSEIIKLDHFRDESISDIEKICLRSITHKLPTKFHLQETSSVKRLRLGPTTPLAVQKITALPEENCAILVLTFQTQGTRIYTNCCRINWTKSTPLAQLPADLSTKLKIPLKEILIAKRGEECWDWEIIKTRDSDQKSRDPKNNSKTKKGTKQKKAQGKAKTKKTTKAAPLLPQNGDVIRVKRIGPQIEGGPEVSDFRSEDDLEAFKRWQESRSREQNGANDLLHNGSQETGNATSSSSPDEKKTVKPRKEEILRIHVDKF